jgi:serine peptidase DegS
MNKAFDLLGFVAKAVIAGLALAFVLVYLWPSLSDRLARKNEDYSETLPPAKASYADAVNLAAPAVVSITTQAIEPQAAVDSSQERPTLRYLYRLRTDLASGVILSEDGYILTNHHVINRVRKIEVALWDGRRAIAQVVGSDPETDLAVLKINLTDLPVAPLKGEEAIRVGDVVLAIGNALGLSHTVTLGIVSATGRNDLRASLYEDFIQTDAAINAGNSGGALVNARGELIGINTRNTDDIKGQNIGFAIPVDLARDVMSQIIEYGSVRRGWMGANFSDLRTIARREGSSAPYGINVSEVIRGGPAWEAGIRSGDVITRLDGEKVNDASRFQLAISQRAPGSKVELSVDRGMETFETYATLIQQPPLRPH